MCAGVSLLWVAVLGGIILYIYAVISFAFLHESFHDKGENPLYCNTLGHCFITVIRWGLIDNLGQVYLLLLFYTYSVTFVHVDEQHIHEHAHSALQYHY